eukprot:Phypoly_transcript_15100.p1 GENE.Phypoly_transcript_15100~~Phypoly_transcript_15100.p1  ORF type:complete len:289 (+),score=22.61 Phypoly_transcript_15100:1-867(+)
MAVQFHVAHSSIVSGAGIVAGPPYYCANANIAVALSSCMTTPALISVTELRAATTYAHTMLSIDNPKNIANSKVYIFSGTQDSIVDPGVCSKLYEYYQSYTSSSNINFVNNIPAEHSFVTSNFGNDCAYLGEPYINNCNYDTAGAIFQFLLGKLQPPVSPIETNIKRIDQHQFLPIGILPSVAAIEQYAYYYLPTACASKPKGCALHVAFHGCDQTTADINTTYVTGTGLNGWAEANGIIVLYPQAMATLVNPQGCWDWWGYTGLNYATKYAAQVATVKNMIDYLSRL